MNRVNPKKLLNSKWTRVNPENKERHFIVTQVSQTEDGKVIGCDLEAVLTHNVYQVDWQQLKNADDWLLGWK